MEIIKSVETENLMKDEKAFMFALKIAYKTATDDIFDIPPVRIGWAFINNKDVNLTIPEYRTLKKKLQRWGIAEFKSCNNGTYARITDNRFFKI